MSEEKACYGSVGATLEGGGVSVSRTHHAATLTTPSHAHGVLLLHYVVAGLYEESTPGRTVRLEPGWLLYKPPGQRHWNEFGDRGATTLRFEFRTGAVSDITTFLPNELRTARSPHIDLLATRVRDELTHPDGLSTVVAQSLGWELLTALARQPSGARGASGRAAVHCAAIIDRDFASPLTLSTLADEVGVDRSTLARHFRAVHGCSVGEYLRGRRIRFVAEALEKGTERSLGQLAQEAGFADQSHMTRTFKRVYGRTPGHWRRRRNTAGR